MPATPFLAVCFPNMKHSYGFGLLGMFVIVFFGAFYSMKRKK